jgi:predicted small lipoprotein YifL
MNVFPLFQVALLIFIFAGCGQKGVSGKVTGPDGKNLEEVLVKIDKSNFGTTTDKDGNYLIDYAPGSFKILFSKNNFASHELDLTLSSKILFPAQTITLYPIYDATELYRLKDKQEVYRRLSPKDEWEILERLQQLKQISNGSMNLTKNLLASLYPFPIEKIDDKLLLNMDKKLKESEIVDIGKITNIAFYNGGVEIEVDAKVKKDERIGLCEISMSKNNNIGENWIIKNLATDLTGNLKIVPFDIDSRFVENKSRGRLFVINGKVRNEYTVSRKDICITGKLYTKGKIIAKEVTFFCGNILSDKEISEAQQANILKRFKNCNGDNMSNSAVPPGGVIPFMVIFPDLPNNIDEFTIEVAGSNVSEG